MNSSGTSIGDIKTTTRTDLGDDWLLCNGADISPDDYPELCQYLVKTEAQWTSHQLSSTLTIEVKSVLYYNDMYYVAGILDSALYLLTATNVTDTWTVTTDTSMSYKNACFIIKNSKVILHAGTYTFMNNNGEFYYMGTTKQFTITGNTLPSTSTSYSFPINGSYLNNKYYIWGASSGTTSGYMVTSSDFSSSSAYAFPFTSNSYEFMACSKAMYANGYYAFSGHSSEDAALTVVAVTSNPIDTDAWSLIELGSYGNGHNLCYHNGLYIFLSAKNSSSATIYVWTSSNIYMGWTRNTVATTGGYILDFAYVNGKYYVYASLNGTLMIYSTTDINSNAWAVENTGLTGIGNTAKIAVTDAGGAVVFPISSGYPIVYNKAEPGYQLPLIETDLSYNYIKAK